MRWIQLQSKSSKALRLALVLPLAFCLVGLPLAASAQGNLTTKVGDATLEEFMAAFANAFEGAHYIQVDVTPITAGSSLGTEVDVFRFPVVGLFPNGPMLVYATEPISPDGTALSSYLSTNGLSVANYLHTLASVMGTDLASNMVESVFNFFSDYAGGSGSYPPLGASSIAANLSQFYTDWYYENWLRSGTFESVTNIAEVFNTRVEQNNASVYVWNDPGTHPPYAIAVYDEFTHSGLSDISSNLTSWLNGNETPEVVWGNMEDFLDGLSTNLTEILSADASSLSNALVHAQVNMGNSITNQEALSSNLLDRAQADLNADVTGFTNRFSSITDAVTNDFLYLLNSWNQAERSPVLELTPDLDFETFSIPSIQVNFDDDRFLFRGKVWAICKQFMGLAWAVFWLVSFWGLVKRWMPRFAELLGS